MKSQNSPDLRNPLLSSLSNVESLLSNTRKTALAVFAGTVFLSACGDIPGLRTYKGRQELSIASAETIRNGEFPSGMAKVAKGYCSFARVEYEGKNYIATVAHCLPLGVKNPLDDVPVFIPADHPQIARLLKSWQQTQPLSMTHNPGDIRRYDNTYVSLTGCRPIRERKTYECWTFTTLARFDPAANRLNLRIENDLFEQIAVPHPKRGISVAGTSGGALITNGSEYLGAVSAESVDMGGYRVLSVAPVNDIAEIK